MVRESLFGNIDLFSYFDYRGYDISRNDQRKRKNRDIFIHQKRGDRRYIKTNHPQGTPHEVKHAIIDIIKQSK